MSFEVPSTNHEISKEIASEKNTSDRKEGSFLEKMIPNITIPESVINAVENALKVGQRVLIGEMLFLSGCAAGTPTRPTPAALKPTPAPIVSVYEAPPITVVLTAPRDEKSTQSQSSPTATPRPSPTATPMPSPTPSVHETPRPTPTPSAQETPTPEQISFPNTPEQISFIKQEVSKVLTPEVLREGGLSQADLPGILEEIPNYSLIVTKGGKREVRLSINRRMIQEGIKVYAHGKLPTGFGIKFTKVTLSEAKEREMLYRGVELFGKFTGLPVQMVTSPGEANVDVNELLASDARLTAAGPGAKTIGNTLMNHNAAGQLQNPSIEIYPDKERFVDLEDLLKKSGATFTDDERNTLEKVLGERQLELMEQVLIAHEMGHAYGSRGHSTHDDSLMNPMVKTSIIQLQPGDWRVPDITLNGKPFLVVINMYGKETHNTMRIIPTLVRHGM